MSWRALISNVSLPRPAPNIDVRNTRADINVDNCYTDIYLSYGLWLFRRFVRRPSIMLFIMLSEVNLISVVDSDLERGRRTVSNTKGSPSCTRPASNTPRRKKLPLYLSILVGGCAINRNAEP